MSNCTWSLKNYEDGKWIDNLSESDVDSFLLTHNKDYDKALPEGVRARLDKIFSLDARQTALNAVEEIKKAVSNNVKRSVEFIGDEGETVKLHEDRRYIGVTEAISKFGSLWNPEAPIVTPFDEEGWKKNQIQEFIKAGDTVEEATAKTNDIAETWTQLTQWGDDIHLIMETIMKGGTKPPKTSLDDKIASQVWNSGMELRRSLIDKYGKDCKFYPELNIQAKEIRDDIKEIMKAGGHEYIAGTIDLLIIDEHGNPHIIDYKVSRKNVGNWYTRANQLISPDEWSSAKKYAIENQLAAYRQMLAQYGLRDATTEIIPFKLDITYDDPTTKRHIKSLNSVTRNDRIPLTKGPQSGNTAQNWFSILPTNTKIIPESFEGTLRKWETLIPRSSTQRLVVQQYEASVEHARELIKTVKEGTKQYEDGWRFYFYNTQSKRMEYGRTKEEIDKKIEDYVSQVNEFKANELLSFGHNIVRVMQGDLTLDELKAGFPQGARSFIDYQFKKYIDQKWTLRSNDELLAAGIFIFSQDNKSEVITMSNESLSTTYNLGLGTSILGKTVENAYVNKKEIMDATVGNIEIMKAMLFIADNADMFTTAPIVQVKCINPWFGQEVTELNSVILDNYDKLIKSDKSEETYTAIDPKLFKGDIPALLRLAEDKLMLVMDNGFAGLGFDGKFSGEFDEIAKDDIVNLISQLETKFSFLKASETYMQGNEDVWMCYWYLKQAYLAMSGMRMFNETDPGAWLSNTGFKMGLYINSGEFSPSTNIRQVSDVISLFASEVRIEVDRLGRDVKKAFEDFFQEMGHNNFMGRKADWYKLLFVTDDKGNITEEFRLKDPSDPSIKGKAAGKLVDVWLKTMAKLRWPKATEGEIESLKALGTYYEVPLTEAAFSRQVRGVGLVNTFRNKIKQYSELTKDVFAGEAIEKENWNREHNTMYNKLDQSKDRRNRLIREHGGTGFFEYDLESIINQALVSFTKSNISKKYIPILDAMKTSIRASQTYGGKSLKTTTEVFDKMIKSKFYGENIIEGEGLQRFARWINVIKRGLSTLQLGFNARSFVRETLQGNWMAMTRSGIKPIDGLSFDTYTKAVTFIVQEAHKNFSSTSMLQQLNAIYGMANQSLGQIAGQRKLHWSGIRNFNKDTVFLGTTAPDFQHRMGILVGKMMGDGCWKAHSLDANGNLVYDWTKDDRFSVYAASLTDKSKESDPKYLEQKMLYMKHISDLNSLGFKKEDGTDYQIGDALPRAYLPKENQGIKNYADLLFGHYDEETKSLVGDMFLGSLFMQYKTYVTSRAEQWGLDGGIYNTETLQWVEDPVTHKKLYKVHQEELSSSGQPIIELKTKDQIEDFDDKVAKNLVEPYYEYVGIPMEGMGRSVARFIGKVAKMDWKEAAAMWKNPIDRDNFILGLNDCLIMALLMMITTGLFGIMIDGEWTTDSRKVAQHARKSGWGDSFAYQVVYGSFQDFPVTQVVGTMFNDWNPTSFVSAKRLISNSSDVIMGNKSFAQAITRSVGALSDFRGLADNAAKAVK